MIISTPGPAFGFAPLTYSEVEAESGEQVTITEVNGLMFGPGVSRSLTINSQTTDMGATGEHSMLYCQQTLNLFIILADADFVGVTDDIIAVNSSPFSYTYTLREDQLVEQDETFDLVLSVGAGVDAIIAAGAAIATITITDNDSELFKELQS